MQQLPLLVVFYFRRYKVAKDSKKVPKRALSKPAETVRERSTKGQTSKSSSRRIRDTAGVAAKPFTIFWSGLKKLARPLRFIIWPFKLRPVRFVGRIISKVLFLNYFKGAWDEVREVTWPSRKETRQLTQAVFAFAIVFGLIVTIVDYGLDKIFKNILLK